MRVDGPGDQDGRRLHRMPTEGVFVGGMAMNTQESQVHLPPVQCWQQTVRRRWQTETVFHDTCAAGGRARMAVSGE